METGPSEKGGFLCQHGLLFEEGWIGETGFFVGTGCLRKDFSAGTGCLRKVKLVGGI